MPTDGLSLVGFMDQQQAIQHLRVQCVPADPSDAALIAQWQTAQGRLGAPIANAGAPDIRDITGPDAPYIQQLMQQPWVQQAFTMFGYAAAQFKLVEIDKLLAYQFIVDKVRSNHHCAALNNPSVADLLPICLPQIQPVFSHMAPLIDAPPSQPQTIIIKVKNLSFQQVQPGIFNLNQNGYETVIAGTQMHVTLPFVHVVRFNGRHYLHNGFHRTWGARIAGATHVPCLIRDVLTPADAGIMPGQTFPQQLLESANPPTMGHFSQNRAQEVQLRAMSRVMHISWSQTVMPDEYERMTP
jgi:hypothetical protein